LTLSWSISKVRVTYQSSLSQEENISSATGGMAVAENGSELETVNK